MAPGGSVYKDSIAGRYVLGSSVPSNTNTISWDGTNLRYKHAAVNTTWELGIAQLGTGTILG